MSKFLAPAKTYRTSLGFLALTSALFFLQLLFWSTHIKGMYFPNGDDFALLVHSARFFHAHPTEWFTRGFADYFRPYPDLAIAYSQFLRPMDNAVIYADSLLFGEAWDRYLWSNYLIASVLVGVVFLLCRRTFKLSAITTFCVVLAAATSPAYTYHVLYRPSFAYDYLGALFALLCLLCLAEQQLTLAWIMAFCAVLSKETAYFTAVSAPLTIFLCLPERRGAQRWLQTLVFSLPLPLVFLLRHTVFHRVSGVYILYGATSRTLIKNAVLGATRWPYTLPGDEHIFNLTAHNLGSLLFTAALWLLTLALIWTLLRGTAGNRVARAPTILLLFFLGSLCTPVLLNLGTRFGAACLPLLFITLGFATSNFGGATISWSARIVLVLCIAVNFVFLAGTISRSVLAVQVQSWNLSRSLVQLLTDQKAPVSFLLTDSSENFSSAEALQQFTAIPGQIVPVINFGPGACSQPLGLAERHADRGMYVQLHARCGGFTLLGTGRAPSHDVLTLRRELPAATITYSASAPWQVPGEYTWTSLDIELQPQVFAYQVIALDPTATRYQRLP